MALPLFALGGRGVISVAANEAPREMAQLCDCGLAGDFEGARAIHRKDLPLMEINFVESNPIPVKASMAMMGLCEPVYRLPMCPPLPQNYTKIEAVMKQTGLLADAMAGSSTGARRNAI